MRARCRPGLGALSGSLELWGHLRIAPQVGLPRGSMWLAHSLRAHTHTHRRGNGDWGAVAQPRERHHGKGGSLRCDVLGVTQQWGASWSRGLLKRGWSVARRRRGHLELGPRPPCIFLISSVPFIAYFLEPRMCAALLGAGVTKSWTCLLGARCRRQES